MHANVPYSLTDLAKRYRLSLQKPQIEAAPPIPEIHPQAETPITPMLLERFSIPAVPSGLKKLAELGHNQLCPANMARVSVGIATCGKAVEADRLLEKLSLRRDFKNKVFVAGVGCLGACFGEPLVDVRTPEGLHYIFGQVTNTSVWSIIHTALDNKAKGMWAVMRECKPGILTEFDDLELEKEINHQFSDFISPQIRWISGHCGLIDPHSLPEYVATGGYFALTKALFTQTPQQVRNEIMLAKLRGRGGGGFLTGQKWEKAACNDDDIRFVIANGDEGDPGAYMDRALLESDPHRVLEGIALASYAIGAHQAYIFVRQEYPLAVETLQQAIDDAELAGIFGNNVLESDYSLHVTLIQSAGAFVCGEETSMIQVIRGHRGEPKPRPPYPAEKGLGNHPTIINNVETLANIPWIVANGAERFRTIGDKNSFGTKIFCLTGDIKRTGLIEVPLGIDSFTVVETIGGALPSEVKALQIGGPSGGIIPYHNIPLDFDTVSAAGAMIGSGGLVVLNKHRCIVDLTCHLISFMADESCGKCLFCRDGLIELAYLLTQLVENRGTENLLSRVQELSQLIAQTSRCNLGRSSTNSVFTTLNYFHDEYEKHLTGLCPAVSCKSMINFEINQALCRDCRCCYLVCPSSAVTIRSTNIERYYLDNELCTRCWACSETCPFGCILPTSGGEYQWRNMST